MFRADPNGNRNMVTYHRRMPQWSISEVAREVGLRPSAIRYYEQIGILPSIQRTSGQRRYDTASLHRLAVIQRARRTGSLCVKSENCFLVLPVAPGHRPVGENCPSENWWSWRRRLIGSRPCSVCSFDCNIAATATLSMNVAKGCLRRISNLRAKSPPGAIIISGHRVGRDLGSWF